MYLSRYSSDVFDFFVWWHQWDDEKKSRSTSNGKRSRNYERKHLVVTKKRNRDKFLEQVKSKPGFLLCEEYP